MFFQVFIANCVSSLSRSCKMGEGLGIIKGREIEKER